MMPKTNSPMVSVATVLLATVLGSNTVLCQPRSIYEDEELPPVSEILAGLVGDLPAGVPNQAVGAIKWIQRNRNQVPQSTVHELLDGLELLALTSDDVTVRRSATLNIGMFGAQRWDDPMPGTVARLRRLYNQTDDETVQIAVMTSMRLVAEESQAAAFLRRIAMQAGEDRDFHTAPSSAIYGLSVLGDAGSTTLRELHAGNLVRDPRAATQLELLAERGYTRKRHSRP